MHARERDRAADYCNARIRGDPWNIPERLGDLAYTYIMTYMRKKKANATEYCLQGRNEASKAAHGVLGKFPRDSELKRKSPGQWAVHLSYA